MFNQRSVYLVTDRYSENPRFKGHFQKSAEQLWVQSRIEMARHLSWNITLFLINKGQHYYTLFLINKGQQL